MVGMQVVLVFDWKINERNKMCVTVEPFDAHTKKAIRWAKWLLRKQANNKTHARTPKWAQRYGLVDTSEIKRKERKSQSQSRYND
jgi:hypothetical protein